MIGGALPLIRQGIAMNDAQAGWLLGPAFALPYGVTALLLAATSRGRRASLRWLIGAVIVWTAGSVAVGAAHGITGLTLGRCLLGIGQGTFVPVAIALLIDRAGSTGRARALALFTSGSTIGRSVALLATGALLAMLAATARDGDTTDWRWLFVLTALPNVLILPFLFGVATDGARSPDDGAARDTVDWPVLASCVLLAIVPVLLFQAIAGWLPSLFVRDRALTPQDAAMIIGAVTLIAAPLSQFVGSALVTRPRSSPDRLPMLVLAGTVATLAPLAVICWAPGLVAAICGVAVMNLTLGSASFAALFAVQSHIPSAVRVSVNGLYFALVTMIGLGAGPLLTGILATANGGGALPLRDAMMMTGLIACGLCALAALAARRGYPGRAWA